MTQEEVFQILGRPTYEDYPGGSLGNCLHTWREGHEAIRVDIDLVDFSGGGRWGIVKKEYHKHKPWWQTLWENSIGVKAPRYEQVIW
jgi:hypothetical protein